MNTNLVAVQLTGEKPEDVRFEVTTTTADSLEAAQKEIADTGAHDEKVVAFIPLNYEDMGVRAFAATLELSIEATHPAGSPVGLEELLSQIFRAGRASVQN